MRLTILLMLCALLQLLSVRCSAQILPPGATPTLIATGFNFTEGPVYDGNGGLLFTNLFNLSSSQIVRYDLQAGTTQVVVAQSNGANGLFLDASGNVISADGGTRQVSLRDPANLGVVQQVLAEQYNGVDFNSPNDLVIDFGGGIYFTDPDYSGTGNQPESVYYIDSNGSLSRTLTGFSPAARPNGIMLSLNQDTLYVAMQAEATIVSYDITSPGSVTNGQLFANMDGVGPDGMTIDRVGNLYAAGADSVIAWDPDGNQLLEIPMSGRPTNVVFGPDETTLYITMGTSLYSIGLNVPERIPGDANGDGAVDLLDLDILGTNLGLTPVTFQQGDFNGDGVVDLLDLDILGTNFGTTSPAASVPEPTSAILLLMGLCVGRLRKS